MQYVIWVEDESGKAELQVGPVEETERTYLLRALENLRPLSQEEYANGPAVFLSVLARYSYVIDDGSVFWLIEWEPGLIIVRMQPGSEQFAWVALRSPVPNFAGRTPLPEDGDPETFDDTLPNPQSQLIFTPFDAQFDVDSRTDAGFQAGSVDVEKSFLAAVELGSQVCQQAYEDNRMAPEKWVELCKRNLADWCGVGVRLLTR